MPTWAAPRLRQMLGMQCHISLHVIGTLTCVKSLRALQEMPQEREADLRCVRS